jgi:hypothetical protein
LDELYREVSDEAHAMHNLLLIRRSQLEEAATRRLERLVGFLGLSSAFPIWFSPSWISPAGRHNRPGRLTVLIAGAALVLGILTGFGLHLLARRSVQRRGP